jgi:hypothetical protein
VLLRVSPGFVSLLTQVFGEGIRAVIATEGRTAADGTLALPLAFESAEVACARVLGLGAQVEVLAPAELRQRVARRASAVAAVYQPDPPAPAPAGRRSRGRSPGPG